MTHRSNTASQVKPELLASQRHTLGFLVIWAVVTAVSAFNAHRDPAASASPGPEQLLQLYLFLASGEWLWVRFIYKGMKAQGRSIREFFGERLVTVRLLAADLAWATLVFGLSYVLFRGAVDGSSTTNPLLSAKPSGFTESSAWVALSLSAGICEEIVFRGYLQRQLTALSGSSGLAIVGQALLFGVAHVYEGPGAVIRIIVFGMAIGALAKFRGNIRSGMLAHAAWDIAAGVGFG